jgi:hypothetical protein
MSRITFTAGEVLAAADVNEYLVNNGYQFLETVYFTSSGTFTKADYPLLRAIRVKVQGAGGGGGGCAATTTGASIGGSGGGGGYAESFITDIAGLDASITVTTGAGGSGGAIASSGNAGGASSFGTAVAADGGGGGTGLTAQFTTTTDISGALGGTATAGDFQIEGGPASKGLVDGGRTQPGGLPGAAGNAVLGFGAQQSVSYGARGGNGQDANDYGGGGSGAVNGTSQTGKIGGDGANGIVIVELYA